MNPSELLEFASFYGHLALLASAGGWALAVLMVVLLLSGHAPRAALVAGIVLGLASSAVLIGAAGESVTLIHSYEALSHAAPDEREQMLEPMQVEAKSDRLLGLMGGVPLAVLALGVLANGFMRWSRRAS
ncbi:MAG: hypothetical protein GQE15_37975 [Archangiaceae bacterium]|nr:hypothetical protein [Archangiaceae bacterium]